MKIFAISFTIFLIIVVILGLFDVEIGVIQFSANLESVLFLFVVWGLGYYIGKN